MSGRQTKFQAIGTDWDIQIHESLDFEAWSVLTNKIHRRIETFDKNYSRFRQDSLVTQMSQSAGIYELPSDGYNLLRFYEQLYKTTNGLVTPLIGQAIADTGYDVGYSFKSKRLHNTPSWEAILSFTDKTITLQRPALLDFGAAGKGYLVDIVGSILNKSKISSYTINAGGDILHASATNQPVTIGLENPLDTSEVIGVVSLSNKSLCASSGSKRKWGNYHHIIDPERKLSPKHILATWVMTDDALSADGLATALFFSDASKLLKIFNFSYALLDNNMNLQYSKDFPVKVFKAV